MKTKLNSIIYNKLYLQAEEARDIGMVKLANDIFDCIGPLPEDELKAYSSDQLEEDIQSEMWKLASNILKYHDLESVDAVKLDKSIRSLASKFIDEIEAELEVSGSIKTIMDPKLPGEF